MGNISREQIIKTGTSFRNWAIFWSLLSIYNVSALIAYIRTDDSSVASGFVQMLQIVLSLFSLYYAVSNWRLHFVVVNYLQLKDQLESLRDKIETR